MKRSFQPYNTNMINLNKNAFKMQDINQLTIRPLLFIFSRIRLRVYLYLVRFLIIIRIQEENLLTMTTIIASVAETVRVNLMKINLVKINLTRINLIKINVIGIKLIRIKLIKIKLLRIKLIRLLIIVILIKIILIRERI